MCHRKARSGERQAARQAPAASQAVPRRAGSSGAQGGCSSPCVCEGEPGPRPHPDCPSSKERVRSDGCRYLQKQIGGIVVDLCCRLGL